MAQSFYKSPQKRTKKKIYTRSLIWFTLSLSGLSALLFFTTPDRVGPLGITLFFLMIFVGLLALGTLIRYLLVKQPGSASQLFVILSSAAITSALAIGTIELQAGDIVLLTLFVVTFSVYWTRLR